jgi:hypothetical protein
MAYNSKSKQRAVKKIEPAITELNFRPTPVPAQDPGPGAVPGESIYYIDLNQINSLVNRRFYRQGLINAVASIKITCESQIAGIDLPEDVAPRGQVQIMKLPTTWVLANAWEKSFRTWTKMNNEALAETESVRPRFLDFKVYADAQHHEAGFGNNLLPVSNSIASSVGTIGRYTAEAGEWESSKVFVPLATPADPTATADREIIAVGSNYPGAGASGLNAVSMIEGYAASRGLPNILDPNTPTDAADAAGNTPANWMQAIFNEGTDQAEDVLAELITENNVSPYPFEGGPDQANPLVPYADTMYPGGANQLTGLQVHDFEKITGTTIGSTTYLRGGSFPCGLIKIALYNYSFDYVMQPVIQINLMPGDHRGLLCAPMTEM